MIYSRFSSYTTRVSHFLFRYVEYSSRFWRSYCFHALSFILYVSNIGKTNDFSISHMHSYSEALSPMRMNASFMGRSLTLSRWNILQFWTLRIYLSLSEYSCFSFIILFMTEKILPQVRASNQEEVFGPPRSDLLSVAMASLGALIAWLVGWLLIFLAAYVLLWGKNFAIGASPIILSMITFFCLSIGLLVEYFILSLIFPRRYTRTRSSLEQIMLFMIFLFIVFTPTYIFMNDATSGNNTILILFTFHVLIATLGAGIITSIVSDYRYSLLGVYGNFVWFLAAGALSLFFYIRFSSSMTALYSLIGLMMIAFFFTTVFRLLFELAYYKVFTTTGSDTLGNIFARVEAEEREREKIAETELTKF